MEPDDGLSWDDVSGFFGGISLGFDYIGEASDLSGGLDGPFIRGAGGVAGGIQGVIESSDDGVLTGEELISLGLGTAGGSAVSYILIAAIGVSGPVGWAVLGGAVVVGGFVGENFRKGILDTFETETPLIDWGDLWAEINSWGEIKNTWPSGPWPDPDISVGDVEMQDVYDLQKSGIGLESIPGGLKYVPGTVHLDPKDPKAGYSGESKRPDKGPHNPKGPYDESDPVSGGGQKGGADLGGGKDAGKGGSFGGGNSFDEYGGGGSRGGTGGDKDSYGGGGGYGGGGKGGDTGGYGGGGYGGGGKGGGYGGGGKGGDTGGYGGGGYGGGGKGGDTGGYGGGGYGGGGKGGGTGGYGGGGYGGGGKGGGKGGYGGGGRDEDGKGGGGKGKPILLDLNGNGLQITEVSRSSVFMDTAGDGLDHRTAWAAAGDGVLFYDPDGRDAITEKRQFVFTEWDPSARTDLEALRTAFDANGDGKLTSADAEFAKFKVLVTNPDGSTDARTLTDLGIVEIDLMGDTMQIELPDGSLIQASSSFTRLDGSTGMVGDVILRADAEGYRVDQVESTDGAGNRVLDLTGYHADGSVAFVERSTISPDGSDILTLYDDNGDGVFDRTQTILTVTNPDSSTTETLENWTGHPAETLENRTVTTTSADGSSVLIERDSTGGGWFDQIESRTQHPDDSWTIVVTDQSEDGTPIRTVTETVSADGQSRTESVDLDGDGSPDRVETNTITQWPGSPKLETVTTTNQDGSTRDEVELITSFDGNTKTTLIDRDGDGAIELREVRSYTETHYGSFTSLRVENLDGSLRSEEAQTLSEDALRMSKATDLDGDGLDDVSTVEETVIHSDGSRTTTTTIKNQDGSLRSAREETLGPDKVTSTVHVDLDRNGTFDASELVEQVTVDGITQDRIAEVWTKNPDSSVNATTRTVTSEDGLRSTTEVDADGDGQIDLVSSDITTVDGAGVATRVVETLNGDGTLRARTITETSADGLNVERQSDADGDGVIESRHVTTIEALPGSGSLQTVATYNGDGSQLLSRWQQEESGDRRTIVLREDADGDGTYETVTTTLIAANGDQSTTRLSNNHNGVLSSSEATDVSANGLSQQTRFDRDGDGSHDWISGSDTALNANGSQTTTAYERAGDGSDLSLQVTTISDDGHRVEVETDSDADGNSERRDVTETTYLANGSTVITTQTFAQDGTLVASQDVETNDDGFVTTTRTDRDGDGATDFTETSTTRLEADGGRTTEVELRDATDSLRWASMNWVSDDGRHTTAEQDTNGDGQADIRTTTDLADNGEFTSLEESLAADGSLQSAVRTVVSADGMLRETSTDADGDGAYERVSREQRTNYSDGSVGLVLSMVALDGSVYSETTRTTSDDGLRLDVAHDWDVDGAADWTITEETHLNLDGSVGQSRLDLARDGSAITDWALLTSADKRTVTETLDWSGDGVTDYSKVTSEADTGFVTTTESLFNGDGSLAARTTTVVSDDALSRTEERDRDGDGSTDYRETSTRTLQTDGDITTLVTYEDGGSQIAREMHDLRGDGMGFTSQFDIDGNGTFDLISTRTIAFLADGTTSTIDETTEMTSAPATMSRLERLESADGLTASISWQFGDTGAVEKSWSYTEAADQSSSEVTEYFDLTGQLVERSETTVSADGRTTIHAFDLDGDGADDQMIQAFEDLSTNTIWTYGDLDSGGAPEDVIAVAVHANGLTRVTSIDLGGDVLSFGFQPEVLTGQFTGSAPEIIWTETTTFADDAATVVELEKTFASGRLGYREVTTSSADGLHTLTTYDIDGDGAVDGVRTEVVTLEADGSRTTTSETQYADGALHSKSVVTESANGRETTESHDYDGNRLADHTVHRIIMEDGSTVTTTTFFNQAGVETGSSVRTLSADGLSETVLRNGVTETTTYSPLSTGGSTWTDGDGNTVSHVIDAFGVETWTLEQGPQAPKSLRLDAEDKQDLLEKAARLYDTVLDRDYDTSEAELFVQFAADNRIDWHAFATSLLESSEYTTRYDTLSDAEFITQSFLNTYGRAPSLSEVDEALASVATTAERATFALELAESAEHLVVGNAHLSTNNFDVITNPAQFERSLDDAYVAHLITNLMDVVHDRAPTEYELVHLSYLLMDGTDTLTDIADLLISNRNDLFEGPDAQLYQLTGSDFVEQAFENAFGRAPTPDESTTWVQHLTSGAMTEAEFVAMLSQSVEHHDQGNVTTATVHSTNTIDVTLPDTLTSGGFWQDSITGSSGNDTIEANSGADLIIGGTGDDLLKGQSGSDIYRWSKGDGNDTIGDYSQSLLWTDVLELTDVAADEVSLLRNGNHLELTITPTGETLEIWNRFQSSAWGKGVEIIRFADGASIVVGNGPNGLWEFNLTDAADTKELSQFDDLLHALGGDDLINGWNGNDTLFGGEGADTLFGNAGRDVLWGGLGDDRLTGGGSADTIDGGDGIDRASYYASDAAVTVSLETGTGQGGHAEGDILVNVEDLAGSDYGDQLTGDGQGNLLMGLSGNDTLLGAAGNDTIEGGLGDDSIIGGANNDLLNGGDGNDDIAGAQHNDTIFGGKGNDTIAGGEDNDELDGGEDDDRVLGEAGDDLLWGNSGNDTLLGGTGDDELTGGLNADELTGGAGTDTFIFALGDGQDTITDFEEGTDAIAFADTGLSFTDLLISDSGSDATISYDGGQTITVTGVSASDLGEILFTDNGILTYSASMDANGDLQETTYANGIQTQVIVTEADGDVETTTYDAAGLRDSVVFEDISDTRDWASYTDLYDDAGARLSRTYIYDSGNIVEDTYENGIRTRQVVTEVDGDVQTTTYDETGTRDMFVFEDLSYTRSWHSQTDLFDDDGVMTFRTYVYDSGNTVETVYVDGVRSTTTVRDLADIVDWDNYIDTFDQYGALSTRLMTYDDGSQELFNY